VTPSALSTTVSALALTGEGNEGFPIRWLVTYALLVFSCGGQTGDPGRAVSVAGGVGPTSGGTAMHATGGTGTLTGGANSAVVGTGGFQPWTGGAGQGGSSGGTGATQATGGTLAGGGATLSGSETSVGGSPGVTGGAPSSGGIGQSGSGGASALDCALRTQADCLPDCYAVYGSTTGGPNYNYVYAGCIPRNRICTDMYTCAYPPDLPESCLQFSSGCFPDGWSQDNSCKFSCPPRYSPPAGS